MRFALGKIRCFRHFSSGGIVWMLIAFCTGNCFVPAGTGLAQENRPATPLHRGSPEESPQDPPEGFSELQDLMDALVADGRTPAAFAAVGGKGLVPIVLCSGLRKAGSSAPVTPDDQVHIGSCTKAMTAVLVARLVEQGKLGWQDTVAERLPALAKKIHGDYHPVTLVQLLSHTGRIPANPPDWWLRHDRDVTAAREAILVQALRKKPEIRPNTFEYSNLGYLLAGQMAAETCGETCEELLVREVFQPLGMNTAGFGPPGEPEGSDQPWGHHGEPGPADGGSGFSAVHQDNAPALGPAGRVHLSLSDWLKFAGTFCGNGPEGYLSASSLKILTTPVSGSYALGWNGIRRDWGEGRVLNHSGSNTYWMATCWIAPTTGRAYLAVVNHGGPDAAAQTDAIVGKLVELERRQAGN